MLIANMLIDMIDCEPTPVSCTEVSHEHEDHANPPEQASVCLCAPVDAGPSVARFTPIVSSPKLASHDFGKIRGGFPL
jgi:hypothetical protein